MVYQGLLNNLGHLEILAQALGSTREEFLSRPRLDKVLWQEKVNICSTKSHFLLSLEKAPQKKIRLENRLPGRIWVMVPGYAHLLLPSSSGDLYTKRTIDISTYD